MTLHHSLPVFLLALLATACGSLQDRKAAFKVTSVPASARVVVMDMAVGTTPLSLTHDQVFPRTYDPALEKFYGRIVLTHEGCKPFTATVSNEVLAKGLHANLECETQPAVAVPTSLHERLRQLKALHDDGLITDDEYNRKRQSLLDSL